MLLALMLLSVDREYAWSTRAVANGAAALAFEHERSVHTLRTLHGLRDLSLVVRLKRLDEDPIRKTLILAETLGVDTIEIDYDCATSALPGYSALLRSLPRQFHWRVTALPAWGGEELPVEEVVLQVHSIKAPTLFDKEDAWRAVKRMRQPFSIALPTYGTTLLNGQVIAADPVAVAEFVREIRAAPPKGFKGFAWFRMPDDASTWSRQTLDAVKTGQAAAATWSVRYVGQMVEVQNDGAYDAQPDKICTESTRGDGLAGFRWQAPCFFPTHARFIRPGESVRVGWVR